MRVFKEEQAFRQWWLILIITGSIVVTAIPVLGNFEDTNYNFQKVFGFIPVLLVVVLFWILKLHTNINHEGITARFEPFGILKRHYHWHEIKECYVRKYAPFSEFGGWGIRIFGKTKAYNVSGNMGIQIVTRDQKRFLIGTKKPREAERVLKYYQDKIQKNEKAPIY